MKLEVRKTMVLFLIVLAACGSVQSKPDPPIFGSGDQEGPSHCSTNSTVLDVLGLETAQDELIIVIARLGKNDTRRNLNQRRLQNVLLYLTEYTPVERGRRKPETVILAEGERTSGLGVIEIYVKGKLTNRLNIKPNWDLLTGTCYADPIERDPCTLAENKSFYPCRDRLMTRPKTRKR